MEFLSIDIQYASVPFRTLKSEPGIFETLVAAAVTHMDGFSSGEQHQASFQMWPVILVPTWEENSKKSFAECKTCLHWKQSLCMHMCARQRRREVTSPLDFLTHPLSLRLEEQIGDPMSYFSA